MAKSLRSKSKVKSRNIKRYNDKTDYNIIQNARLAATSSRLAQKNKHGKTLAEEEADEAEGVTGDEKMGEASTATAEDDSAAVATENGWYQQLSPSSQHSMVLKDKVANQEEATDTSFVLLGLCDPDSISLATIEADGPGEPKKVSTSGKRESRRELYRESKGWGPRKGSKNNGRTKRRR